MGKTLNEIILMNVGLGACFPQELGALKEVTVFDAICTLICWGQAWPEDLNNVHCKNGQAFDVQTQIFSHVLTLHCHTTTTANSCHLHSETSMQKTSKVHLLHMRHH
ncbi:hypothetical protein Leryth_014017 [Lithospermum erythrorhizon]|nr:hypothetical protein Leryth_014017 [Lithospermum erythrorhizon]